MNIHLTPRKIWLCVHGETDFTKKGILGGDPPLNENGILFTGIKDGFEYIDGIKKGACFAEYTGESFYCNIPDVKDYNTKYTIIKFTPDYSQDYCFNRSGGDTVIKIQRNGNNIQTGSYDVDDEEYNTYLYGGETYYIGVAM